MSAGLSHVVPIAEGAGMAARAGSVALPADARTCPACAAPLPAGRRVCSGPCRAELSRRRRDEARDRRDQAIRAAITQAVDLVAIDPAKAREHLAVALCFLDQSRDAAGATPEARRRQKVSPEGGVRAGNA